MRKAAARAMRDREGRMEQYLRVLGVLRREHGLASIREPASHPVLLRERGSTDLIAKKLGTCTSAPWYERASGVRCAKASACSYHRRSFRKFGKRCSPIAAPHLPALLSS